MNEEAGEKSAVRRFARRRGCEKGRKEGKRKVDERASYEKFPSGCKATSVLEA